MTTKTQQQTHTTSRGRTFDVTPGATILPEQYNYVLKLRTNRVRVAAMLRRVSIVAVAEFMADARVLITAANSIRCFAYCPTKKNPAKPEQRTNAEMADAYRMALRTMLALGYAELARRGADTVCVALEDTALPRLTRNELLASLAPRPAAQAAA